MQEQLHSVLVVDDDASTRNALRVLLERGLGVADVRESDTAERALNLVQEIRFSLIISDYQLEGMDGVTFLETLRAQGVETPLILLSGTPDKHGVLRALSQPHVDFLGKPFEMRELTSAMHRLMMAA